jgi:hypothetical protein
LETTRSSPPVLHRWEPGLETTRSSPPVLHRWEPGLETSRYRFLLVWWAGHGVFGALVTAHGVSLLLWS